MFLMSTANTVSWILLIVILVGWIGYTLFKGHQVKQVATYVDNDQFKSRERSAQVIDLREKNNFNSGHILGARNIPYSTLKNFYVQIRADLPVYLYDQGSTISKRAALFLAKNGYHKIYILKSGYQNWDGKEKKGSQY